MNFQKSLWLFTFLSLSVNWLQAERIFILFDPPCMDRLEYKQAGQPGSYVVYQVNLAPGERVILEVGQESGEYRGNMPSPLIGCNTGIFDAKMVENINRGIDEVFMINRYSNGTHTITQVSLAAAYQFDQRMVAFNSPKYQFRFDLENGAIGENIASSGLQREVYFEGRMEEQCLGAYIFRQFAPRAAKPHLDLVFIPKIGIVEERAGFTLDEALSNALKLENINGVPLDNYIQQLCNQGDVSMNSSLVLAPYGSEVTPAKVFSEQPDMVMKGIEPGLPVPAAATPASGTGAASMHTISAGETLYSISKKYGVSVNQLKTWNGLKSNTIYKGRQLVVSDPASTVVSAPTVSSNAPSIASPASSSGLAVPAPYDASGQKINLMAKGVSNTQQYHVVRTGETVASIARKYGYTEARYREINGLKANEQPKIGQQLKTTDCNCPDDLQQTNPLVTAKSVNPYEPKGLSTTTSRLEVPSTTSPVNNYSYPSPSAYDNSGKASNPNSRPFSSYNDTPVPATGSITAPSTYSGNTYSSGSYYNSNTTSSQASYNQPSDYSNYASPNTTTARGVNNYNTNDFQASGLKRSHIVKDGETLYDIARQYGTTVERLRQLNRLETNEIVIPNQKIFLE